jgi:hypothetical protein
LDGITVTPSDFWRAQFAARSPVAVSRSACSLDLPDQKLSSAILSSRRGPIRGVPSVATGSEEADFVEDDIGLPQMFGGKGQSDTSGFRGDKRRAESQPHHRDTPPEDVYVVEAGLLARGSMLLSGLPETNCGLSDFCWTAARRLQLRGQLRLCTGFPLSFGPNEPEAPRRVQLRSTAISVNTDADGQLPINPDEQRWASEAIQACGMSAGTMVLMMEASSAS